MASYVGNRTTKQSYQPLIRQVTVEHDALMSPNPRGKLEDLVAGCLCVV